MHTIVRRVSTLVLCSFVAACVSTRGTQQGAQTNPRAGAADAACDRACLRYFECKGSPGSPDVPTCSVLCQLQRADPAQTEQLAVSECTAVIAAFEGGTQPAPGAAAQDPAVAPP